MRDGLESEGPAEPDPARGARPAVGGVAAALLPGALGTSRIPPTAVIRFRGVAAIRSKAVPPAPGPLSGGANRAPADPAISKPSRFTGPGREPPGMPQSVKSKAQVDDLRIP